MLTLPIPGTENPVRIFENTTQKQIFWAQKSVTSENRNRRCPRKNRESKPGLWVSESSVTYPSPLKNHKHQREKRTQNQLNRVVILYYSFALILIDGKCYLSLSFFPSFLPSLPKPYSPMSLEDPSIMIMAWFPKGNVALASAKGALLQHCFSAVHAIPTHIPPRGMLFHDPLRK